MPFLYITKNERAGYLISIPLLFALCALFSIGYQGMSVAVAFKGWVFCTLFIIYLLETVFGLYDEFRAYSQPDSSTRIAKLITPIMFGIVVGALGTKSHG